jgi:peptidoglycan/xylan/chitin deacetylase (PgdA/CDA1 family)
MAKDELVAVRVTGTSSQPHLSWAEGALLSVPHAWLRERGFLEDLDANGRCAVARELPALIPEEASRVRLWAAYTEKRPIPLRLRPWFRMVPMSLRNYAASRLGQWQRRRIRHWAMFPRWPLDLSADFFADLVTGESSPFFAGPTPVVLTHDIDTLEGLRNLQRWFLSLEESVAACSTSFIVPHRWPIDHSILTDILDRGHEIGIHGFDHSNRTPFLSGEKQRLRLARPNDLIDRYGIRGYRSPSLLRTRSLMKSLGRFYEYDSSIPTAGGVFSVQGTGCGSARPFVSEGIAELPVTLPRDASLRFLGYNPTEILRIWKLCAEYISRSGGVIVVLTHCEARFSGDATMFEAYRRLLDYVADSDHLTFSTAGEVLQKGLGVGDQIEREERTEAVPTTGRCEKELVLGAV